MYENIVVVNSVTHRDTKIRPVPGYAFAKGMNSCAIQGPEFLEAAKFYPIVFAQSDEAITPVVILGLTDNSFIGPEGQWETEAYIPAFIRRYPYILAEGMTQDGSYAVCIDKGYAGFDQEEGERMFDDEGKNTPFLDNAIGFLRAYQDQFQATKAFVSHIKDLNLFKKMDANITLSGGQKFTLRDFSMIDEEAMRALPDEVIVGLVRQGYMPWIYSHLYSVTNFNRILSRVKDVAKEEN